MFQNQRKTIGVFLCDAAAQFQNDFCVGVSEQAYKDGFNVAFFTLFGAYHKELYGAGEISIGSLPDYSELDGILILPGTFAVNGLEQQIIDAIRTQATCPVVSIMNEIPPYPTLLTDDLHSLDELVLHFIQVHGFTRIGFLSGPRGNPIAEQRLASYTRILTEQGLSIEEGRIFYGDFWTQCGQDAARFFFDGPLPPPQAIVCANDSMALSLCAALGERGLFVPEDVAISGCDNIFEATNFIPPLTTVHIAAAALGRRGVALIQEALSGAPLEDRNYCGTRTIFRESCGCQATDRKMLAVARHKLMQESELTLQRTRDVMFMSIDFQTIQTMPELCQQVLEALNTNTNYRDFYLCLSDGWQTTVCGKASEELRQLSDHIRMVLGIKDGSVQQPVYFSRKTLLPDCAHTDEPMLFYFAPLHYHAHCFGYTAISFRQAACVQKNYQAFTINVSNALEGYRVRSELHSVADELKRLYVRDVLTGLYNRRGFETQVCAMCERAYYEQKPLLILCADINNLKHINDQYGHASGDQAISTVGAALQQAARRDELCARCGGDEFHVAAYNYSEEDAAALLGAFRAALDALSAAEGFPYPLGASCGYVIEQPKRPDSWETMLIAADTAMYRNKKENAQRKE